VALVVGGVMQHGGLRETGNDKQEGTRKNREYDPDGTGLRPSDNWGLNVHDL